MGFKNSLGISGFGILAFAAVGCGKDLPKIESTGEAAPAWTSQAYDVQSTWHNTNEAKLTKKNVGDLVELWSIPLGLLSTVTVVDNRVYTAGSSGISAIDADSGSVLWTQSGTPEQSIGTSSSPSYDDGVLYVDNGVNGFVYALKANTGDVIWSTQIEQHPQTAGYSTPIVYGDRLFVGVSSNEEVGTMANATFKGSVVALDKKSGKVLWQTHTAGDGENGCAVWSTVALDPVGRTVYATTGNNYTGTAGPGSDSIFALDMKDGAVNWRVQASEGDVYTIANPKSSDSDFGANPVVFDYKKKHYVAAGQKSGNIYVYDRDSGEQVISRKFDGSSTYIGGIFQALAWDGEYLYTVNNRSASDAPGGEAANGDSTADPKTSVMFALEPLTLDIVWERQLPAWVWSPMTLVNGMSFLGAETLLEAIDNTDGSKLFEFKTAGTIIGAPVVNNGRVYVTSGLTYFFGHPDDKLHALALPDDPAVGKHFDVVKPPTPDPNVPTFANVYKAVIAKSCIDAQCHGSSMQGNLGLSSMIGAGVALVNVAASGKCAGPDGGVVSTCGCSSSGKVRVVPGKPEESLLVEKLSGNPSCGDRMPPTGEPLPEQLQNLVKSWIKQGAQLN
jgi:polyvinyl alcohol dehydrogenase (cytochrome)